MGLALATTTLAKPAPAQAGWREMGLVMVSMHESSDEAEVKQARTCYTRLRKALTGEEGGDVMHVRFAKDSLTRKLGAETMETWRTASRESFKPLVDWEPKTWRGADGKVTSGTYTVDAWVLVDCAPGESRLDIVTVVPATGSVMRLHLGGRAPDAAARAFAKSFVMGHAWADWEP